MLESSLILLMGNDHVSFLHRVLIANPSYFGPLLDVNIELKPAGL